MDTTGDPVRPVTGPYRWTTSPVRAGTGEPLHRLEPVPVRGFTGPVHRLVGSENDKHSEATERRVLDSISEGAVDKSTRGRDRKTRHLKQFKSVVYTSNYFVVIRDKEQTRWTWCKQSVASCLRVQGKPVERPWRFLKDLQSLVGIICRNIFLG